MHARIRDNETSRPISQKSQCTRPHKALALARNQIQHKWRTVEDLRVRQVVTFSIFMFYRRRALEPRQHVAVKKQLVAGNKQLVARNMLLVRATCCRATCCAGVNAALGLRHCASSEPSREASIRKNINR